MTKIATSLLAGTAFFGLAAVAQAADMGSPLRGPSVIPSMSETSSSGGWYLRGDIGYIFENKSGFTETEIDSAGALIPKSIASDKLSSAPSLSVGLGYQFNDYLRGDI
ncbi:MAG: hypothetical protein LWW93_14665, partial [Hyphomicrobiales bacterium]|nr:hypothetical protein [Hyphomicrobiales bacterium]